MSFGSAVKTFAVLKNGTPYSIDIGAGGVHNTNGYQYYFSSADFTQSNNGIGVFVHGRQIYVKLNGSTYGTIVQLAHRSPTEITVTSTELKDVFTPIVGGISNILKEIQYS